MSFRDNDPFREIDNELKTFRGLFDYQYDGRNDLLISRGGTIAQYMVELLARLQNNIKHDIYSSEFKEFLDNECDFIPEYLREFVFTIYEYKNKVIYKEEYEKELDEVFLPFLTSFHNFLFLYRNFFTTWKHLKKKPLRQLQTTIRFLEEEINRYDGENYDSGNYQNRNTRIQNQSDSEEIKYALNKILQNQERERLEHENQMEVLNNQTEQLNTIENKVDNIAELLKEYNSTLAKLRETAQRRLETAKDNEIRKEKIYSNFNHDSAVELVESVDESVDTNEYDEEEEKLIDTLGESAWGKLERDSQKFLVTSKITYKHLSPLGNDVDYSGVCLSVTKALEVELKKRFYQGFIDYLDDKNYEYSEYHSTFFYEDIPQEGNLKSSTKWTLGGIPHILGSHPKCKKLDYEIRENNRSKLIEYSRYALFDSDKHDDKEIEKTLKDYGRQVNSITDKYRNKAAHTDRIKEPKAKQCLDYVIDVEHFLKTMLDSFDKEEPRLK